MDKDVILVGGFHEVIELCEKAGYNIVGIIDSGIDFTHPAFRKEDGTTRILKMWEDELPTFQ